MKLRMLFTLFILFISSLILANNLEEINIRVTSIDTTGFHIVFYDWIDIWERQDLEAYMSLYHPSFFSETSDQNFAQWRAHKTRVFNPLNNVRVTFIDPVFEIIDDTIRFEAYQDYTSRHFNSFGFKTIVWVFYNDQWLIISENFYSRPRLIEVTPDPPIIDYPVEPYEPDEPEPYEPYEPYEPEPCTAAEDRRLHWETNNGFVPFDFINFLFPQEQTYYDYLFLVEKIYQHAALYRFIGSFEGIELIQTYRVSTGQKQGNKYRRGDLRTPEGLYRSVRFYSEENLISRYGRVIAAQFGTGAFVLDYPNALDRVRRKTGSGIWIHGTDQSIYREFDTDGCIRFENHEILYFKHELGLYKFPVITQDRMEWTTVEFLEKEVQNLLYFINNWHDSWQQQDIERYLTFYCSYEFISHRQRRNHRQFETHKRAVFARREPVRVFLIDKHLYYADNLLLVSFYQDYRAHFTSFGKKDVVLRRSPGENGELSSWAIIQEEFRPTYRALPHHAVSYRE